MQHDRVGLLVVRAFVDEGSRRRLVVRLLEVSPPGPDRVLGVTASSRTAARIVGRWLDSLNVIPDETEPPDVERRDGDVTGP